MHLVQLKKNIPNYSNQDILELLGEPDDIFSYDEKMVYTYFDEPGIQCNFKKKELPWELISGTVLDLKFDDNGKLTDVYSFLLN